MYYLEILSPTCILKKGIHKNIEYIIHFFPNVPVRGGTIKVLPDSSLFGKTSDTFPYKKLGITKLVDYADYGVDKTFTTLYTEWYISFIYDNIPKEDALYPELCQNYYMFPLPYSYEGTIKTSDYVENQLKSLIDKLYE